MPRQRDCLTEKPSSLTGLVCRCATITLFEPPQRAQPTPKTERATTGGPWRTAPASWMMPSVMLRGVTAVSMPAGAS